MSLREAKEEMRMKITRENWKDAERDLRESGIQDAIYDESGFVQTITTTRGLKYEFSPDIIRQLMESGEMQIRLGRSVENR
jgi:hypothetical protein